MVISLVPKHITGMDILSNWQNSYTGFLTYEIRPIIIEKAKWKPWELPFLHFEDCKIKNNTASRGNGSNY